MTTVTRQDRTDIQRRLSGGASRNVAQNTVSDAEREANFRSMRRVLRGVRTAAGTVTVAVLGVIAGANPHGGTFRDLAVAAAAGIVVGGVAGVAVGDLNRDIRNISRLRRQ